jgi:hypothetical protein
MKTPMIFVADLVAEDETGMMGAFVAEAIQHYAKYVLGFTAEQITEDTRINGHAWLACAQAVRTDRKRRRTQTIAAE